MRRLDQNKTVKTNHAPPLFSSLQAFMAGFLLTFILMFVVLCATDASRYRSIAHLPVLAVALPRALELVGVAYMLDAANRYGADESANLKDELAAAAKKGGDAVKKLAGK